MYVFYTHHRDARGKLVCSELKLSSSNSSWYIAFKNKMEELLFELCKKGLKFGPPGLRSYDDDTKVWTFLEDQGAKALNQIDALTSGLGGVTRVEVPDLQSLATQNHFDLNKQQRVAQNPEDFFYNPHAGAPAANALTAEKIQAKLSELLGLSVTELVAMEKDTLKRQYRRAALRLHPDRNNGDGSKMSDLNMLWGLYNG